MTTTARLTQLPQLACCDAADASAGLSAVEAQQLAAVFKALADPSRLRLLSIVAAQAEDGGVCVCNLTEPVGLSQPTVSHHLRVLVDAGLLTREQRGKWAYYAPVPGALAEVADALSLRPS